MIILIMMKLMTMMTGVQQQWWVVAIKPAACERDNPPIVLPMEEITREIHTLYLSSF